MIERLIIVLVCLTALTAAHARMYQWQDPDSGTTHFSGNPPPWYRTGQGPRVIVFEKGEVIDDTRIELSAEASNNLRLQAIARAEDDRENVREKARAAEEMKARLETEDGLPVLEEPDEPAPPLQEETDTAGSETDLPTELSPDRLKEEEMRALIQEWERRQTEQAMDTIQPN